MFFGCWLFIVLLVLPVSLWKFSHFCSRPPFRVFTLEYCSFFPFSFFFFLITFHFSLSYYALENSSRIGEWFIKNLGWGKETTVLLITKNFSRKTLFSPSIHVWSKWTFQVRNVGQSSWFEKKDKHAQIVFQGDLNQGSFHERSFFIIFSLISLSSLFFNSPFLLVPHFFFILAHFYFPIRWAQHLLEL